MSNLRWRRRGSCAMIAGCSTISRSSAPTWVPALASMTKCWQLWEASGSWTSERQSAMDHHRSPSSGLAARSQGRASASLISRSPHPIARRYEHSSMPRSPAVLRYFTSRACGPSTTRTTSLPLCAILTATTSRLSVIGASERHHRIASRPTLRPVEMNDTVRSRWPAHRPRDGRDRLSRIVDCHLDVSQ